MIPELQKRGIYWDDYPVPGGTARENLQGLPGQPHLPKEHPGVKIELNGPNNNKVVVADEAVEPVVEAEPAKKKEVTVAESTPVSTKTEAKPAETSVRNSLVSRVGSILRLSKPKEEKA